MRSIVKQVGAVALAAALAVPLAALAQAADPGACPGGCPRAAGAGPRGRAGARMFDPKSVTTVQGDVVSVDVTQGRRSQGVHLTLAVGSEKLRVVLGPRFYLDQQAVKVAQGDRIEVKGSRITWGGEPVLVAQEVKKGEGVLQLRQDDGTPLWSPRARG